MGLVSVALALAGPWLLPLFVSPADPHAARGARARLHAAVDRRGYQIFDGFNLGAGFCLRGAGDVRVPTLMVMFLSWFGFVPLAHMLSFAPGQGWVHFLPQFGLGAVGGWSALLVYTFALGGRDVPALALGRLAQDQSRVAGPALRRPCSSGLSIGRLSSSRRGRATASCAAGE